MQSKEQRHQQKGWSPYVGPRPFRRDPEDQNVFFGRKKESENIISLIYSHKIVLIYAQSGAGKTSIFNASIAPALEARGLQVLPLTRVGISSFDTNQNNRNTVAGLSPHGVNPYILNALQSLEPEALDSSVFNVQSLSQFLNDRFPHKLNHRGKPVPQILIFDQLEELFNLYSDPVRWHEEQEEFFKQVTNALNADPLLRVIFIIREDYLSQFDPFADLLPEKLRPRFRLERLRRDAALEAVKAPLEIAKDHIDSKLVDKLFNEGIIDKLVEDLLKTRVETFSGESREIKGEFVEPIQLQVVSQRLWNRLKTSKIDQINQDHFGDLGDVDKALEDFYTEAIDKSSERTGVGIKKIRKWFEENLITSSGTRGIVHRGFESTGGIPNTVVEILEDEYHLIRKEERSGARWYELTHDRLIKPILDSNKKWNYESEKQMEKAFAELLQKAIAIIPRTISSSQLEKLDQDEILEAFYEEMIEGAMGIFAEHEVIKGDKIEKARIIENKLREWCEKTLITSTGERAAIQRGNKSSAGMINSVIDFLEDNYMLKGKSSLNGMWYELAHDKLVEVIQRSNKALIERQELEKRVSEDTTRYVDFYARVIREVTKETWYKGIGGIPNLVHTGIKEADLRNWCETKLITPNGTRAIIMREAETTAGLHNTIIDKLENAHLIIARQRLGTKWYELTYDKLVGAIKTSNREWKFERDKRKRKKKILAVIPVIFGLVGILIITSLLYVDSVSHEPCAVQNVIDTTGEKGPPVDIIVSPKTSIAYASYPDSNVIKAISCNREKLTVTPISVDGRAVKLGADPTSNKIYALTTNNNTSVIDSNNDLDLSDISEIFGEASNGAFDDILYNSPEFGNPQKANVIPSNIDLNTNSTLNSETGKIYVPDNNNGIIHVKSSKGDPQKDITGLGTSPLPFSLIENSNTNKIYVINPMLPKVSVIDSKTDRLLRNISVGNGPIDIAIDEIDNKIYVANEGSGTISVIDGNKDQVVQIIPITLGNNNRLQSIAVDSKSHLLYLGFWYSDETGSVSIVNPAAYNDDKYIQVSQSPIDIDFNTNTSKLYVAEFNNRSVAVINTNTDNVTKDISLGESKSSNLPFNIAINPNSNKIYVANVNSGNNDSSNIVSVITGTNDSILKNVSLPFLVSDIAIDPNSNKLYVTGSDKNQSYLSVIDGQNDTIMNSKSFPFAPSDIAVNSNTSNIYLANNDDWSITTIDRKGDNKTIPLSIPPESIVVDPAINRIYVSSYSKPSLSKQQSDLDPKDIALPRLTQMQIINGSNNHVLWNNQTLKLDPRLGDMILSFNPITHDLVATSPSTNTIQSWNINQVQDAIERLGGILSSVKPLSTGIDYAQLALTNNGSKLYIVNPAFNTIKVENVSRSF